MAGNSTLPLQFEARGYSCESTVLFPFLPFYADAMSTSRCLALFAATALATVVATAQSPGPTVSDIPAPGAAAAPAAPAPLRPSAASAPLMLPAQTPIPLQMETHLSTRDNQYGDGFAARVMTSVFYQGREVVPAGSILEGHIIRVRDERPAVGDSQLLLKPDLLTLPDGTRYTISAVVTQTDPLHDARVDSEGMLREPRGMMTSDLHHTEAGVGGGLLGGALIAGGQGAIAGAGIGAAIAAGIWLVRHRHLELNPGSRLTVRLDRPLQLRPH